MDFLGSAAFSKAVQALDTKTGMLVCLKIIKVGSAFHAHPFGLHTFMLFTHPGVAQQHFISSNHCSW